MLVTIEGSLYLWAAYFRGRVLMEEILYRPELELYYEIMENYIFLYSDKNVFFGGPCHEHVLMVVTFLFSNNSNNHSQSSPTCCNKKMKNIFLKKCFISDTQKSH